MTVGDFLVAAPARLQAAGIETARLDCIILLEDILGIGRASLLAHPEKAITAQRQAQLDAAVDRRETHEPLAYIRGKAAFFGRTFLVNEHVLVPRPETEHMIELLKGLPIEPGMTIIDVGTGSGCIGISTALEIPVAVVLLTDIDSATLEVARANAKSLDAQVVIMQNDLLKNWQKPLDIVLANLPYVPDRYPINRAAAHEPSLALFAGSDGLRDYKMLLQQINSLPNPPRYLLTESLPEQHHVLARLARNTGYALEKTADFIQLFERI